MKLKPLFDNVVLKPYTAAAPKTGNIILQSESTEYSEIGIVCEIGSDNMQVAVGDKVLFSKYSGSEFVIKNEKYILLKQTDILAIMENK